MLACDLARLCLRRWSTLDASLRTLEVEGFPVPGLWLGTAVLAGGNRELRANWMGPWMGTLLLVLAMSETLLLGFGLMITFLFGSGTYTFARGITALSHRFCDARRRGPLTGLTVRAEQHSTPQ